MSEDASPLEEDRGRELKRVLRRRELEALAAGMSATDAYLFAGSDTDIAALRHLIELRCPVRLLREILL